MEGSREGRCRSWARAMQILEGPPRCLIAALATAIAVLTAAACGAGLEVAAIEYTVDLGQYRLVA